MMAVRMNCIAGALAIAACAPEHPTTPAECRQLRHQSDIETVVAEVATVGAGVAAVVSAKVVDPNRDGPRTTWAGIAVGSAGFGTVAIGHAWFSDRQADEVCSEVEK